MWRLVVQWFAARNTREEGKDETLFFGQDGREPCVGFRWRLRFGGSARRSDASDQDGTVIAGLSSQGGL
jgi:hypothetical protein